MFRKKDNNVNEDPGNNPFQLAVDTWNREQSLDADLMSQMNDQLRSIRDFATETGQPELAAAAQTLVDMLQIAECAADEPGDGMEFILHFVSEHAATVFDCADSSDNQPNDDALWNIQKLANQDWGDSLQVIAESDDREYTFDEISNDLAEPAQQQELPDDTGSAGDASQQIDLLLSVLGRESDSETNPADDSGDDSLTDSEPAEPQREMFASAAQGSSPMPPSDAPQPPVSWSTPAELMSDTELRDAFLDDANRCLAEMESVVLDAQTYADDAQRCQTFCRQLHTLKGASASVALEDLATYLHEVEEWLEYHANKAGGSLDDDFLLAAVDSVRQQMAMLESPADSSAQQSSASSDSAPTSSGSNRSMIAPAGSNNEATIRVRASQLDKLMGMLAELVAIRNHREARFAEFSFVNQELTHCSNRLRRFNDERNITGRFASNPGRSAPSTTKLLLGAEPSSANAIDEVANDLVAVSRELSNNFQPLAKENTALSQFIRHFRQELMQLRRLPVGGLFQRLNRSIRDAARLENKKVDVRVVGEDTGLEQSVQERLYEPLLHMVRNSVSHGIEPVEVRRAGQKPECGTVTLHASASASMLVIKVQDDGRGLDYKALRQRGMERGLLATGSNPSKQQLAKLIFHPGFSTRDSASQVSGRGIGMDVVATAIDRMQGRIEVDSEPGMGTTIRVSIPLTTGIEHVMQFRSGDQLFALPMQSIHAVKEAADDIDHSKIASLSDALQLPAHSPVRESDVSVLMLDEGLGVRVDEVLGPDEVVVRPLPQPLRRHPLFNGVVLSASGETVMLLNADRINQWCQRFLKNENSVNSVTTQDMDASEKNTNTSAGKSKRRALVVDDSLSARKGLARRLRSQGFTVSEAGDGLEALNCLSTDHFDLVTTDLDMPRMGGLELLGEIKRSSFFEIPVVVVSSRQRGEVWKQASENGAVAFIGKPATDEALNEVIQQLEAASTN